jgi:cyclin B
MAAAAIHVALRALGLPNAYPKALVRHSRYSQAQAQACAVELAKLMVAAPTHSLTAVHKKYSNPKFLEVAKIAAPLAVLEEAGEPLPAPSQPAAIPAA